MQPLAQQFHQYLIKLEVNPHGGNIKFETTVGIGNQTHLGNPAQPLALATIKNYVSDVSIFLDWLADRLQETQLSAKQLTPAGFTDYRQFLNRPDNHLQPVTAQRHLASLKRFGSWLHDSGRLPANPAAKLNEQVIDPTADQLLTDFKSELIRQKLSPATIKNYLSDLKNYINWASKNYNLTDNNIIKL